MEKEQVGWYNINQRALDREGVVPNLKWLIPMAYNFNETTTFEVNQRELSELIEPSSVEL